MEGILAITLQKYYKRSGNRIVFKNGMSLSELSLEMWERLGFSDIDSSSLSRVLRGERLLNIKQLEVFAEIVGCEEYEFEELANALLSDIKRKYRFENL